MVLIFVSCLFTVLYLINKYFLNHWKRRGIPQGDPKSLFGDFKDSFLHKISFGENVQEIYEKSKSHRVFGVYVSYRPMLQVNDPKIIRDIMMKDSNYFPDRGTHSDKTFDPLSDQLFFQGGVKWKKFRSTLTRAFTSEKLKKMLPIASKNLETLKTYIKEQMNIGSSEFDFRDLIARLNTNIISSVAFGLEVETINEPQHVMRQMGVKVFEPNLISGLRFLTSIFLPIINKVFKFKIVNNEVETFFRKIINDTVEFRETTNYERNDLMQKLIQLKNDGFNSKDESKISISDIFAQSFGFYLGGFETTSTTVSFCLYELAKNQNIQRRVQEEIDSHFVITDNDDDDYEMIKSLKYLESCMKETLRKFPPLPVLNRVCVSDYKIDDSSIVIKKGTPVLIPIFALQRDKEIYEEPLKFNPERFMTNPNGSDVDGMYYLPFGEGQRICIGHRMGKQNVKLQLATLLSTFNFELIDERSDELKFNPKQLFLQPIENIKLRVSLRNKIY